MGNESARKGSCARIVGPIFDIDLLLLIGAKSRCAGSNQCLWPTGVAVTARLLDVVNLVSIHHRKFVSWAAWIFTVEEAAV